MALRIAIVDDEPACRAYLRNVMQRHCSGFAFSGEAGSVAEGRHLLEQENPDLLLLDVQMEDGTGFDLLDQLPQINFNVIFTTAYDAFAIRAFRYNAIDYLLKPVDPDELCAAVGKAQQNSDFVMLRRQIDNLLNTAAQKNFERLTLPTAEGPVFIQTADIVRLESYGNYAFVFLASGERILASRNLKEFEEMLPAPRFFRVHQSHIVHTAFVKQFRKEDAAVVHLQDGAGIPVARRKKEAFAKALGPDIRNV
ncbi:MAG: response regulator transcription factor [Saprospiraceae bacterium]|nr:response regulator transcription factor [Saprospiraceae bacterium]